MKTKPTIAHVITRLLRGGAEENTILCCQAQQADGCEVVLAHGKSVSGDYQAGLAVGLKFAALPSLVHPISPLADLYALAQLVSTFRRIAPDVVHTHESKAGVLGRIAGRLTGAAVVVHTVHIISFANVSRAKRWFYVATEKLAARFCDAMIFVSEGARAEYARAGIGAGVPTFVIPSGMDIDRFRHHSGELQSSDARRLANEHADKIKVLYLSAFEERKRHKQLIEALGRRRDELSDCHFIFAGEGNTKDEIRHLVKNLGLTSWISIVDHCSTPEDLIAVSDLGIYASQREGLPRAVIQSLAAGKPVAVARLPGIEEVVADRVNGAITPSSSLEALVDQVLALSDDTSLRDRLTEGARRTDLSNWEVDVMTNNLRAVYQEILAAKGNHHVEYTIDTHDEHDCR